MNHLSIFTLKVLRKLYCKFWGEQKLPILKQEENSNKISKLIYKLLTDDKPCMIARFGSTELSAMVNFLGVTSKRHSVWKFIKGEQPEWWWNPNIMKQMQEWSGFFPSTSHNLMKFGELMLKDMQEVDLLGSWLNNEYYFLDKLPHANFVPLRMLEPFWATESWGKALKDKKILVVHPFAETIKQQYKNRDKLFNNPDILPEFASLHVIKAVQSLGGNQEQFKDWFEALQWMKDEIDKHDYDICLIGCGAYGFPLAAYVKRQGKKAFHLGGALQLLFGIRGKRWENPMYGVKEWGIPIGSYSSLMNEYWIRPNQTEKTKNAQQVEGACYW